jgi:hypothetical protein
MPDSVETVRMGAIASEKELEMHADMLEAQPCPRCGHHALWHERRRATPDDAVRELVLSCRACDGRRVVQYELDDSWEHQPGDDEPRLTNRRAPSALIPPAYLAERIERSVEQVQRHAGELTAALAARLALEAIDELEKHRRDALPTRRSYARMKTWLRTYVVPARPRVRVRG